MFFNIYLFMGGEGIIDNKFGCGKYNKLFL